MNEFDHLLRVIRARRSIRRFAPAAVSREQLKLLVEAARWAPSNHNRQPWRFIVLDKTTQIKALAQAVKEVLAARLDSLPAVASAYAEGLLEHATSFATAPVVVLALHKQSIKLAAGLLDGATTPALASGEPLSVAMAVQNLLLAAQALGLGSCVLTAPLLAPDAIGRTLALPDGFELTCLVALGYPAETPAAPRRKELEHIVEFYNTPQQTSSRP